MDYRVEIIANQSVMDDITELFCFLSLIKLYSSSTGGKALFNSLISLLIRLTSISLPPLPKTILLSPKYKHRVLVSVSTRII